MSRSFASLEEFICPTCGQPFSVEVWLIVDAAERPDLVNRIRANTLHVIPCLHCQQTIRVAAPLFVITATGRLLFAPAASDGHDLSHALDLAMAQLNANLPAWMDQMQVVAWPELVTALDDNDAESGDVSPTVDALAQTFRRFVQARSWDVSQQIVEAHPELLTDAADTLVIELIAQATTRNDADVKKVLTVHQALLRRCRVAGIPRAFAEKVLSPDALAEAERMCLPPEDFPLQLRAQRQMPPELRDILAELAARGVEIHNHEDFERAMSSHPDLAAQLAEGTSQGTAPPPVFRDDVQRAEVAEQRYLAAGESHALDTAIEAWMHILQHPEFQTAGQRFQSMAYNNAGAVFVRRFQARGHGADLDVALNLWQRAVATTAPGAPNLPGHLTNLGNGLRTRFARTGSLDDLGAAIQHYQRAVAATPPGALDLPMFLNNLGAGLSDRFARTGSLDDLEAAIEHFQRAVAASQPGAPDLPIYLNNLGNGLSDRFAHTDSLNDLEAAIQHYQRAVAATLPGAPSLPSRLNNLGNGLSTRFGRTGSRDDLESATSHYRNACRLGAELAPPAVINAARNWGNWAVARNTWTEVTEAFGYGLETGRRLLTRQLRRTDKETVLRDLQAMAASCAYAWAKQGDLQSAIATLEGGRARLMAEALERSRADLERLPVLGHAALYKRYLDASIQLDQLLRPDAQAESTTSTNMARLEAIRAADAEMGQVITAIRNIPGYADFLASPTFEQIAAAVGKDEVMVYLLTTTAGGLGLIVQDRGVTPVWLAGVTDAEVRAWLFGPEEDPNLGGWLGAYQTMLRERTMAAQQAWFAAVDDATQQLWTHVMGPLASVLKTLIAPTTNTPEIVLIPDGLLALLPLHCAWEGDAVHRRYFLDEFTVRYAPSARALSHASAIAQRVGSERLLAIDEPQPVSGNRLPNSAREVAAISGHFTEQTSILQHTKATRAAVLQALPMADVAHFSCHGFNHWQMPLESGLIMANNEALTVRDLLELHLPGGRLAVLSACETGIAGTQMPNESVMLSSALLQAGFAGVVASLWSVPDMSTAMLMARFYDLWREKGMEPAHALREAQRWVRDTTTREKALYFGKDVPGATDVMRMATPIAAEFFLAATTAGADDEKSFAHPHYWAAFTYTGV